MADVTYDSTIKTFRLNQSGVIRQQVSQKGVARLLSKTYAAGGDAAAAFYNGEEFGVEIDNQIPIVYGKVLLKGKVAEQGQLRSDFDADRILKVYRFTMGESGAKGIVGKDGLPGVPGHKLENVLINCKPAQDPDTQEAKVGGLSLKDNAIPLVLGGAMFAIPTIAKLFDKDPTTGETIENLAAVGLKASDMISGMAVEGQHIVVGPDGTLIAKSLATSMLETVDFAGTKACKATVEVGDPEPVEDEPMGMMLGLMGSASDSIMMAAATEAAMNCGSEVITTGTSSAPPPEAPLGSLPLLKHTGTDKYYAQPFDLATTGSVKIHLYYAQLYTETTSSHSTGTTSTTKVCKEGGAVKVKWCVIDAEGNKLDEGDLNQSGLSGYNFTANFDISMATARANSCDAFTGPGGNATLRLYREDEGTSSTDCYFQGFTAEPFVGGSETRDVEWPSNCPEPVGKIDDDDLEPHQLPSGSFGTEKCPEPAPGEPGNECCPCCEDDGEEEPPVDPDPITGCLPVIFKIADKAGAGGGGTDPDDTAAPTLAINGSRDKTFDPTANTVQFPPMVAAFGADAIAQTGTLTVKVVMSQGTGSIGASATAAPASFAWDAASKTATITGPLAQLNTVLAGPLVYTLSEADKTTDMKYTASITDNTLNKSGGVAGEMKFLNNRVARPARSGSTNVTLSGTSGSVQLKVGGVAVSGVVPFTTNLTETAKALAASVTSTVSTPNYTATWVSGSTITLVAPAASGDRANGTAVTATTTGTLTIGTPSAIDGGVTKTEAFRSFGSKAWSVAKEVLPVLGSGLIAYSLYKSIAQMEIELPEDSVDEEGNIAVIYEGQMVKVPSNYDPETRVYTGEWDGTFKAEVAYTNNPAWCLLDFVESKRYGAGNAISMNEAQWAVFHRDIYYAAVRCDEMVNDGRGEMLPRYTLNTIIANMTRLQVMESISSCMHSQPVLTARGLRLIQDRPSAPKMIVTDANAFAKGFDYSGGTLNASYNNVEVSWNNPAEYWRLRTTEVMDALDIVNNGERKNAVVAFGCTDEAQAQRHGAWILTTEKSNPLIVSYSASFDHAHLIPGDIVILSDSFVEAVDDTGQFGGRVLSGNGGVYTLDRSAPTNETRTTWWIDADGELQSAQASFAGNQMTVAGTLRDYGVFVTTEDENASGNLWKILSITEHSDGEFAVTAVKYDPNKYTDIDGFAVA